MKNSHKKRKPATCNIKQCFFIANPQVNLKWKNTTSFITDLCADFRKYLGSNSEEYELILIAYSGTHVPHNTIIYTCAQYPHTALEDYISPQFINWWLLWIEFVFSHSFYVPRYSFLLEHFFVRILWKKQKPVFNFPGLLFLFVLL